MGTVLRRQQKLAVLKTAGESLSATDLRSFFDCAGTDVYRPVVRTNDTRGSDTVKKTTTDQALPNMTPKTLEEFKAAVKYVLMNRDGAPELVADALLADDPDYLVAGFAELDADPDVVLTIADELTFQPKPEQEWVRRDAGVVVVPTNEAVASHLEFLVGLGVYGEDAETVAAQLLVRGIESILPLVEALARPRSMSPRRV